MNNRSSIQSLFVNLVAVGALAAGALATSGCASRSHVSYVSSDDARPMGHATGGDVEVLLDRAPSAPHVVTGYLFAQSVSNPSSIVLMKQKAKAAGLDGIYWVDCTSTCSGHCSAKGYVYLDHDIASRGSERVASKQ